MFGIFGHLGLDYSFEDPAGGQAEFLLRHVDYGLPGDSSATGYRHSIARHTRFVSPCGAHWPPLRTPHGHVFRATPFRTAPRAVGDYLQSSLPRFWGDCGAYRTLGPNSNTGLRAALRHCEQATRYRFGLPPLRMLIGAWGWNCHKHLEPCDGPYPGYELIDFVVQMSEQPGMGAAFRAKPATDQRPSAIDTKPTSHAAPATAHPRRESSVL
ncbi:MAG: hypothetical protein JNG88_00510 [Phycisphaerales bacterium]|nr:hypothetical protein [Phycisphaerales bacterium]